MRDPTQETEIITLNDVKRICNCGYILAERYIKASGAALPRVKNSPYKVRKSVFMAYLEGTK